MGGGHDRPRRGRRATTWSATLVVVVAACGGSGGGAPAPAESTIRSDPTTPASQAPATRSSRAPTTAESGTVGALRRCESIAPLTTDVTSTLADAAEPDPIFLGVLLTYAEEHRRTFGGIWIDRDAGGTVMLAFTDDPDAHGARLAARRPSLDDEVHVEPRPPIVDERPIGDWDERFDVVHVRYSEEDIEDTHEQLGRGLSSVRRISGIGIAPDASRNQLAVWGVRPDDERIVEAAASIPPDRICVAERSPYEEPVRYAPGDAIDVIPERDDAGVVPPDTMVSCGGAPFPVSALEDPVPVADSGLDGIEEVLERFLGTGEGRYWAQDGWEVLVADRDALLLNVRDGEVSFVSFTRTESGWSWDGAQANPRCPLRATMPDGLNHVDWRLDKAFPAPGPDSTELHLRVSEVECASGKEMGDRLLGPQIVETEQTVMIAFAAIAQHSGQDCQGNPWTPVVVTLPSPLGDRALGDGTVVASDIRDLRD